jgi:hypothetical protein
MTTLYRYKAVRNKNAKVRRQKLNGREHLVVPMVMITEGVHHGSGGPGYYPDKELSKNAQAWNSMPIVVNHPDASSARTPEILSASQIGVVLNTKYNKPLGKVGRLNAEAWIDIERAELLVPGMVAAIEDGGVVEVSTGLFAAAKEEAGTFNNKAYEWVANAIEPDHLAILPDQVGACSVADGCGCGAVANCKCGSRAKSNKKDNDKMLRVMRLANKFGLPVRGVVNEQPGEEWKLFLVNSDLTFDQVRCLLNDALRAKFGIKEPDGYTSWPGWIEDIYPGSVIYTMDGKLYNQAYLVKDGTVEFVGDPDEDVKAVKQYRKADGTYVGNAAPSEPQEKEVRMNRKEQVDALIANKNSGWTEADREFLMNAVALPDAQFARIVNAAKPAPIVENAVAPKAVTLKDLLSNATPEEKAELAKIYNDSPEARHAAELLKNSKQEQISRIKNFADGVYSDADLEAMELPALTKLANAVSKGREEVSADVGAYGLASGGPRVAKNATADAHPALTREAWNEDPKAHVESGNDPNGVGAAAAAV